MCLFFRCFQNLIFPILFLPHLWAVTAGKQKLPKTNNPFCVLGALFCCFAVLPFGCLNASVFLASHTALVLYPGWHPLSVCLSVCQRCWWACNMSSRVVAKVVITKGLRPRRRAGLKTHWHVPHGPGNTFGFSHGVVVVLHPARRP